MFSARNISQLFDGNFFNILQTYRLRQLQTEKNTVKYVQTHSNELSAQVWEMYRWHRYIAFACKLPMF